MRRADLHIGQEVFVRLPYSGGVGWAEVVALDCEPEPRAVSKTVRIRFLRGEARMVVYHRERLVAPSRIIKGRES